MISDAEYRSFDALALAEQIRCGQLSAREALEAAIARAETVHAKLNAIVIPMHEIARKRASETLEGPFAGVPFLVKDLLQDYEGVPASSGCLPLREAGYRPTRHSEIVRRYLAAGAVIFGRTATPEFGGKGITESVAWGATRNPWNLLYTPGGSSGGSAAAVAAGIVPIAGANDGAGSIRIPASYCGLFGFKPGRARNPNGPDAAELVHGAVAQHVVSRTVRDSAAMLDATHGHEPGGIRLEPPEMPYLEFARRDPRKLRVAFTTRSPLGGRVDPEIIAATTRTATLLESLGHEVSEETLPLDGQRLVRDFLNVWYAQMSVLLEETRERLGNRKIRFELDSMAVEELARSIDSITYARCQAGWNRHAMQLAKFLKRFDVILMPTVASLAPKIGELKTPEWIEAIGNAVFEIGMARVVPLAAPVIHRLALKHLERVPFTQLANLAGVPAMSVPLATFENGLPMGMQFVAGHGDEGLLFSLAGQLERTAPWIHRTPDDAALRS